MQIVDKSMDVCGVCIQEVTSLLQVLQRPEQRVSQLILNIEERSHATAWLVEVLHFGAKLIHDVPHRNLVLCRLDTHQTHRHTF